jgi:hypothetical protein
MNEKSLVALVGYVFTAAGRRVQANEYEPWDLAMEDIDIRPLDLRIDMAKFLRDEIQSTQFPAPAKVRKFLLANHARHLRIDLWDKSHSLCKGTGTVVLEDETVRQCECFETVIAPGIEALEQYEHMMRHMGRELEAHQTSVTARLSPANA